MWAIVLLTVTIGQLAVLISGQKCDISSFPSKLEVDKYGRPGMFEYKHAERNKEIPVHMKVSKCQTKFSAHLCTGAQQITLDVRTPNATTLMSKCCEFPYLTGNSANVVQVTVRNGEHYSGGEILDNGKVTHFNLVKDVRLLNLEDGSVEFVATIYQMTCKKYGSNNMYTYNNYDRPADPPQPQQALKAQTYQAPFYQQQAPIAQASEPIAPPPPSAQALEPLQPAAGALIPPVGFPPGIVTSDATTAMPSFFGPFSPFTFAANMILPTVAPPAAGSPFEFGLSGRARGHQAPTFQVGGPSQVNQAGNPFTLEEYERRAAWRDYYARNPQYYLVEKEEQSRYCFSGDMVVETPAGPKQMKDVKVGDRVLVDDDQTVTYQPVIMWLHRLEDQWADFYRIETVDGPVIEATAEHALFQSDCLTAQAKYAYAKDIRPGMCLVVQGSGMLSRPAIVVNVTVIRKQGIYAPLTPSGKIIVNRIMASCYANLLLPVIHNSFFNGYRMLTNAWTGITGFTSDWATPGQELPLGIGAIVGSLPQLFPVEWI